MILQIIPNSSIDNTKVLGLVENIHYYRSPLKRLRNEDKYIKIDKQYIISYEIIMSAQDVSFYLGFDDELKDNIETELNVCWKHATFKRARPVITRGIAKELELAEHYFLSLKTDLRGEYPLSNILETQNILRDREKIHIRLEMQPVTPSWYREVEQHIDNFNKRKVVATKTLLDAKTIGLKAGELAFDAIYTVTDFINDMITDVKIEHEYPNDSRYSKLIRNGLSTDTQQKSRYYGYKTRILITIDSERHEMLFRNILKAFNSMKGDNSFVLVNNSRYKNVLCSKEITQIMQMPTRMYQDLYKINNIDNREVEVPKELFTGSIKIGDTTHKGFTKTTYWPDNKNVLALPKIIIGPMGSGKDEYTKNFVIDAYRKGDGAIIFDYIKNCEMSEEISKKVKCIKIDLSKQENLFALAYPELQPIGSDWDKLKVANMLSRQVEYLINSLSDEPLSSRMIRYLDAACKVVFIHRNSKVSDVLDVLTNWKIRNEYIRKAKYSGIFKDDDIELLDLESLHDRDKEGKIVGTKESKLEGIFDRINILMKDIYLRSMIKTEIDYSQNFSKYMDEGKIILIQMPEHTFTNKQVKDTIVTYFMSRIWLSALQRHKHDKICHIVTNEIHQVPTTAALVANIITEPRKFGIDFYFTIHYLKQFKALHDAIRSAGASYMLLAGTEKENLVALEQEIKPFTIEEGLNMKPFESLNTINYGNQYATFISKMPDMI